MLKLEKGDFVRYIGHTNGCPEEGCSTLMPEGLLGKIYAVSAMPPGETREVCVVVDNVEFCFFRSHVEVVLMPEDPYQEGFRAGFKSGMERAAELAELAEGQACACVSEDEHAMSCEAGSKRISEVIKNDLDRASGTKPALP